MHITITIIVKGNILQNLAHTRKINIGIKQYKT